MYTLRYEKPGGSWMQGLPVGNGRLAAMVWEHDAEDVLTLNHEWLWRGVNRNRKVFAASDRLEEVRDLLRQGKYARASLVANLYFGGDGGIIGERNRVDAYQPAGELRCAFPDGRFISRSLDMEHGVVRTCRDVSGVRVDAMHYASAASGLLVSGWQSHEPFDAELSLLRARDEEATHDVQVTAEKLVLDCAFRGGLQHRVVVHVYTDGVRAPGASGLAIHNATYIHCIMDIGTSVKGVDRELQSRTLSAHEMDADFAQHQRVFFACMQTVDFSLDEDKALIALPIEERLARFKAGGRDNGICALYYHYGRYLLLSSSAGGDLPANLQGKWNDMVEPPWDSDYHFDINLEMNYWMTGPCGMPECSDTLLNYLESFYESGAEAAKALYGCRGIWLPIQTDAWGIATPESFGWAVWIGAAPWMAMHFWRHYEYTGDQVFLRERAYRFFTAVAEFYEDYLVEDAQGVLQIMPSQSPENRFEGSGPLPVAICISSAMDVQLCYDALGYAIRAAEILGIDPDRAAQWRGMQARLPPFGIGKDGRLLEWNEEKAEVQEELGHRHLSHLYGVYPSDLFTQQIRQEQYDAARKSLAFRLSHGGGHTGWSRAWISCLQARFGNAEGFYEHYSAQIREFATITFLDLHPPGWFQIDGNFGAVAAVNDMLARPVNGEVHLLTALPKQWASGRLRGLRLPGGHVLDMAWAEGRLVSAAVVVGFAGQVKLQYGDQRWVLSGAEGERIKVI